MRSRTKKIIFVVATAGWLASAGADTSPAPPVAAECPVEHDGKAPLEQACGKTSAQVGRDATRAAGELPCECARLLKVRSVEMAEARIGGPVPPTNEGEPRPAGVASSTIYYLSFDCGGKPHVARVPGGTPGFQPDELETGTLHLRAEGGKIFLKGKGGTEFEATLIATPTTESPQSR